MTKSSLPLEGHSAQHGHTWLTKREHVKLPLMAVSHQNVNCEHTYTDVSMYSFLSPLEGHSQSDRSWQVTTGQAQWREQL